MALRFTKRTILTARQLEAKAVVLHLGRVEIADYTRELIALKLKGNKQVNKFKTLKEKMMIERKKNAPIFFDSTYKSLKYLSNLAFNEGIKLGLENRFYYREIPNYQELQILLDNFSKKNTFFWYDTGHAYIQEKLGFDKVSDYLDNLGEKILGAHLHDVINLSDHKAPFTGEINFNNLKILKDDKILKVIEVHQPVTKEQIIYAKKKLEEVSN